MDFVAIDFHTVNFSRDSACAFGYAKVENGEVVATGRQLIHPPYSPQEWLPTHIKAGRIRPEQVSGAPLWRHYYERFAVLVEDYPLVAHNMPVQGAIIDSLSRAYGLPMVKNSRYCTLGLAKYSLRLPHYTGECIYRYLFPERVVPSRNVQVKAVANAHVALRFAELLHAPEPAKSLPELFQVLQQGVPKDAPLHAFVAEQPSVTEMPVRPKFNNAMRGEMVVFSGRFHRLSEAEMSCLVQRRGGVVSDTVDGRTTILVTNYFFDGMTPFLEGISTELRAGLEEREKRSTLRILTEDEFYRAIGFEGLN
ncbi:MAG TPA: hypothetical protein GX530_06485 [Corynebacteriales bacterium]|nr:hypothetical protein [Mycobacteriales bacterium]